MVMDLASLESVRNFVEDFKEIFDRVDLLILNGGVSIPFDKKNVTLDGFEITFGINHLAHFLLTNLLLEHCKKGAPSR
jgi:NAD(P)-dependent dehydrogenase (short-subunit alcohol dehydrogenase family)